jgi:hypothetical protein
MPDRRSVLLGLTVAAASPLVAAAGPDEALRLFVRLKAALSGKPVALAYRADLFLTSPDAVMPLVARVEGLSWTRAIDLGGDRWEFRQIDAGCYLDALTGARLRSVAAPDGTRSRVKDYRTPGTFVATPDALEAPRLAGRTDVTLALARRGPDPIGDVLVATEDLQTTFGGGADGRVDQPGRIRRRVSQFSTFTGPLASLGADSIPAVAHAIILTDTRPWLPELAAPLPVMWRMVGHKLPGAAAAPASIRAWLAAEHPDLLEPPTL